MIKYFKIHIDVFNYTIYFIEFDKTTSHLDIIKKFGININYFPVYAEHGGLCYTQNNNSSYIIYSKISLFPVRLHEICHAVDFMFEYFEFDYRDKELRAYLTQYLVEEYLKIDAKK